MACYLLDTSEATQRRTGCHAESYLSLQRASAFALQTIPGGDRFLLCTDELARFQRQVITEGFPLFTATQFLRTPILLFLHPVDATRSADEHPAPHGMDG